MASGGQTVYRTTSCKCCENVDTDEMVQCDNCDSWFNFNCVGVTSDIAFKDWSCDWCAFPKNSSLHVRDKENWPPECSQWRKTQSIDLMSSVSTKRSRNLALQKLEEERELCEKRDREYLRRKYSILEHTMNELGEHRIKEKDYDKMSFDNTLRCTAFNQRFNPVAQSSANVHQSNTTTSVNDRDPNAAVLQTNQQIGNVGIPKKNTNPFIDLTEVSSGKPLQSDIVDGVDVDEPSFGGVWSKNPIQPSRLRYNPIQPSKLLFNQPTVQENLPNERQPKAVDFTTHVSDPIRSDMDNWAHQISHDKFNSDYGNKNWSQGAKRPKIGFDFGFTTTKSSSSNAEIRHGNNNPSMEKIRLSIRTDPVTSANVDTILSNTNPNTSANINANMNAISSRSVPVPSNFGQNSSNNLFPVYGPTVDYRQICFTYIELTPNQIAIKVHRFEVMCTSASHTTKRHVLHNQHNKPNVGMPSNSGDYCRQWIDKSEVENIQVSQRYRNNVQPECNSNEHNWHRPSSARNFPIHALVEPRLLQHVIHTANAVHRRTNFHGANNVFCEELMNLDHDKIQAEFVTSETSWSFNPPKAAHMGGIWERMVGIVKRCLDEILTVRYPTDEMLRSLFAEVMNMVNSRPLTYVSLDSPDDEILTPNHFLLGTSSGHKPPGTFTDVDTLRKNWRAIQAMSDKFWRKFVDEYLPTLMQRTKWHRKVAPLQVGDVVLLVDSNFQRNTWLKGIVVETFMDKSGQVRSARVRTATGTIYRRPVSHLVVLDVGSLDRVKLNSPNQLTGKRLFDNTVQSAVIA